MLSIIVSPLWQIKAEQLYLFLTYFKCVIFVVNASASRSVFV